MSRTRPLLPLLLLAALAGRAAAAGQGPVPPRTRPFPYAVGWRDAALLPAGLGLSLLGDAVQGGRDPLALADIAALTPDDVNPFDRTAARSWSPAWADRSDRTRDALLGAAVLASFAPPVLDGRWREAATLGVLFAESALLAEGTTYVVKGLAGRKRPYVHNTSLSASERHALATAAGDDVFRSFFSGHVSAAFTLAALMSTVFTDVHGRSAASDALWGASMSVAALTAFARVKAGQHYPSDVLAGAVVGTAIGTLVPALHRTGRRRVVEVAAGPGGIAVRIPLGAGP